MIRSKSTALRAGALCAALMASACSMDPYQQSLPASAALTLGEVEEIAQSLPQPDADLFRRWAARIGSGHRMPYEASTPTVKNALLFQQRFEGDEQKAQAEAARKEAENQAAAERAQAEAAEQQREWAQMTEANAAISTVAQVDIASFRREPVYGATGVPIGSEWVFYLKIRNRSPNAITGLRGMLRIEDQFAENSYSARGQLNVFVPPGSTVDWTATIKDDERQPLFRAMRAGSRINYEWLLYSVAFQDGSVFDHTQISAAQTTSSAQ